MAGLPMFSLPGRGVIEVAGHDAQSWLDNLITGDLSDLDERHLVFAALLTPQGKVLFEFFVHFGGSSIFLETTRDAVGGLMKRLGLYKLRAQVSMTDVTADWGVLWGRIGPEPLAPLQYPDPRAPRELWRSLCPKAALVSDQTPGPYLEVRVRLGIGEAPDDYSLGDVFPHEANMDLHGGVSFTKGCYIGQEVVSRMQNKAVVRKRVVRISGQELLTSGSDVTAGDAVIGRVGSVAGRDGLAMVRLDRVIEALDQGATLRAGSQAIHVDTEALQRYRQSVQDKPVIDL